MKKLIFLLFGLLTSLNLWAQEFRNVAEYNLNSAGVSVIDVQSSKAFDPVAYFPEGGSVALEGKAEISLSYEGVEYYFANEQNKNTFLSNPQKYEPTYGSWCARAMVTGAKVPINARLFTVKGNRLYLFVNTRAKRFFDRNIDKYAADADREWEKISGEKPRL